MNPNITFCPKCGFENNRMNAVCQTCGTSLPKSAPFMPNPGISPMPPAHMTTTTSNENKFKILTGVFLVAGLVVPLWIITLPLFWFLAYLSYKKDWTIYNGR